MKKYIVGILLIILSSYIVGGILNSLAYGGGRLVGAWVMFDGRTFLIAGLSILATAILYVVFERDKIFKVHGKKLLETSKEKVDGNMENSAFLTDEERDEVFLLKTYEELGEVDKPLVIVRAEELKEEQKNGEILKAIFERGWNKVRERFIEENGESNIRGNTPGRQKRFVSEKGEVFDSIKADNGSCPLRESIFRGSTSKENRIRYEINFTKASHALVIGTTGSGKTTAYINPTINILSKTKMKPSMLISDPKGELLAFHKENLEREGYIIKTIDLRRPFNSVKWNPLAEIYATYQRMLNLDSEMELDSERGVYIFEGREYRNPKELLSATKVKKQQLYDDAYEDLHDIITCLCPITNDKEPIWESGARNFALAIALAMLEDSKNPDLFMTKEKFNFYNLAKIATDSDKNCAGLKKYFSMREPLSKAVALSRQVLTSADNTRNSYLTTLYDRLSMFSDMGVCSMTSSNEISFKEIVDKPCAIFLQIPDEKETRHTLASMIVLQAYKELVARANQEKEKTLKRPVYFILDEFGNLPAIHKIEQMITVGRSRNIWLCLVVQSYAQLAKSYGSEGAEIIKANCNIQVFIGTTDQKTLEEMSKRCGNYGVVRKSIGTNSEKEDSFSENFSINERPLIYPSELAMLNRPGDMGNAIVTVFGFNPLRSKFTPSYMSQYFPSELSNEVEGAGRYFDEEGTYYDMKKRNVTLEFLGFTPSKEREKVEILEEENVFVKHPIFIQVISSILEEEEMQDLFKLLKEGNTKEVRKKLDLAIERAVAFGKEELIWGLKKAKETIKSRG